MLRPLVLALLLLPSAAGASYSRPAAADDGEYARANARLARATPRYPRARLLVEEPVMGEVGSARFEAVQRIYLLSRPATQPVVISFYAKKLGPLWRRRGAACLVSRSRLVLALVYPRRRRLGVLIDSRGAARCAALTAQIGDLLAVGYPDT